MKSIIVVSFNAKQVQQLNSRSTCQKGDMTLVRPFTHWQLTNIGKEQRKHLNSEFVVRYIPSVS